MACEHPSPAGPETDKAPREQVCCDEHDDARDEAEDEQSGGERLIAEVRIGRRDLKDLVVGSAEVLHDVLEVAHVPEEVLAEFLHWLDCRRGGYRWSPRRIGHVSAG